MIIKTTTAKRLAKHLLILVIAGVGLTSCVTRLQQVTDMPPPQSDGFTDRLIGEYRKLALFEAEKMYDFRDANHYVDKIFALMAGEQVDPDQPESRDIEEQFLGEMRISRERLVAILPVASQTMPKEAAIAQSHFDCWLEQQEEGFQHDHIAACKRVFDGVMTQLASLSEPQAEDKPAPKPAAQAQATETYATDYRVFYDFDSSSLTPRAEAVLGEIVVAYHAMGATRIKIVGHTDTSGGKAYNKGLSLTRANSVKQALVKRGLPADGVSVEGRGEESLLVATPDGVRNASNRRAEVVLDEPG